MFSLGDPDKEWQVVYFIDMSNVLNYGPSPGTKPQGGSDISDVPTIHSL